MAVASAAWMIWLAACGSSANDSATPTISIEDAAPACPTGGEEWEVAKVYIEHNATDEDTGIHGLIGGAPWRSVCVTDPDGRRLWAIQPSGRLGQLGVADYFWESNEPPNDEYSIADLEADFPEGSYVVSGTGVDGIERIAEIAWQVNEKTENIGARRLHTVMERLLEEVSFMAPAYAGRTITVDADYVNRNLSELADDEDLTRYIL